jgi:TRAP-type mannitol/chloroaromatic compound transport system permease small subunit
MWLVALDGMLGAIMTAGLVLVLPVSLLLFLQWPLRDLIQIYSREANDMAQWLFALYVSVAITYATRRRSHLAADALAQHYQTPVRARLARLASLLVLLPWSLFILYAAWPALSQSVLQLEGFPETFNPGYFLIKVGVWLLALLVLLQALVDILLGPERQSD